MGAPRIVECAAQTESSDSFEVPRVARHEFEVVVEGGRSNLKVGIRQALSFLLERGADSTEDAGRSNIVGQDSDRRKDAFLDVLFVPGSSSRVEGAVE